MKRLGGSDPDDGDGTPSIGSIMQPNDAASSVAFGGARPKVVRYKARSSTSKSATSSAASSPPRRLFDGYRTDDRLSSLDSGSYPIEQAELPNSRLVPEELSFDVSPPLLRSRHPRELLRTNSSDSFLPASTREATAVVNDCSAFPLRTSQCLNDSKRSSFDESRLLDLCAGGGRAVPPTVLFAGGIAGSETGAAACSVPSITSSNVSMSDLRADASLSELDLYEAPEDDCYIYTYKGGTAYLSADLPHSFFRLDSGSDGESLPGVSGAGQSNLSTGIAALIQDQLISGPPRPDSPEEQDFLELDFDPGSEDSESSSDSGQGREEMVESAPDAQEGAPHLHHHQHHHHHHHRTPSPIRHSLHLVAEPARMQSPHEPRRTSRSTIRCFSGDDRVGGDLPVAESLQPPPVPLSRLELDLPLLPINTFSFESGTGRMAKETANINNKQPTTEKKTSHADSRPPPPPSSTPYLSGTAALDDQLLQSAGMSLEPSLLGSVSPHAAVDLSAVAVHSAPLTSPADGQLVMLSLPRSKSLNSSFASSVAVAAGGGDDIYGGGSGRFLSREILLLRGRETLTDLSGPLARLSLAATADRPSTGTVASNLLLVPRAMIWTEKEACRRHVSQIGRSACGATALVNVALALNLEVSLGDVAKSVRTRLRREQADLPDYLHSRAEAGCTHEDLLLAMRCIGQGRVTGRFFPMHGRHVASLHSWLATWIGRGCVPVATLNPQRGGGETRLPSPQPIGGSGILQQQLSCSLQLADAWHHQMIFGVTGHDIYLTNPLMVLSEDLLRPQLDSPSELLVRREDIIARFSKATDLTDLLRPPAATAAIVVDRRWHDYNVLGQVANVLREERSRNLSECENVCLTPFVRIPASYASGITLFCETADSELVALLNAVPEFPLTEQ